MEALGQVKSVMMEDRLQPLELANTAEVRALGFSHCLTCALHV